MVISERGYSLLPVFYGDSGLFWSVQLNSKGGENSKNSLRHWSKKELLGGKGN